MGLAHSITDFGGSVITISEDEIKVTGPGFVTFVFDGDMKYISTRKTMIMANVPAPDMIFYHDYKRGETVTETVADKWTHVLTATNVNMPPPTGGGKIDDKTVNDTTVNDTTTGDSGDLGMGIAAILILIGAGLIGWYVYTRYIRKGGV